MKMLNPIKLFAFLYFTKQGKRERETWRDFDLEGHPFVATLKLANDMNLDIKLKRPSEVKF